MAASHAALIKELNELIGALDVRIKHVERIGEAVIASDAAALKRKAIKRLAELGDLRPRRRVVR